MTRLALALAALACTAHAQDTSGGPADADQLDAVLSQWRADALDSPGWSIRVDGRDLHATYERSRVTRRFLLRPTDAPFTEATARRLSTSNWGVSFRWSWRGLEPESNSFRLAQVKHHVALCDKHGVPYQVRLMCGHWSPRHASPDWVEGPKGPVPVPWRPMCQRKVDRLHRMVARVTPRAYVAHVPGWKGGSEAMPVPALMSHPEFTPTVFSEWHLARSRQILSAWPGAYCCANLAPPGSKDWIPLIVANMERLGPRAAVQSNALSAKPTAASPFIKQIIDFPGVSGWQMVWWSDSERFGGTFAKAVALGELASPLWYEVYLQDLDRAVETIK